MKKIFSVFYLLVLILGCKEEKDFELESLTEKPPVVISENGPEIFQYWEFERSRYLFSEDLGEISYLRAYKDSIADELGPSVLKDILDNQRIQSSLGIVEGNPDGLSNFELIHKNQIGEVRDLNYLEAELLNYQASRFPLFSQPTEFHGFVLINVDRDLVRVYFGANDQPWPPKPKPIIAHVEEALEKGWKLMYHLHNHYEEPSNGYIGAMAPSLADVHYFKVLVKRFGLQKALITNGFTTLVLPAAEFDKLNSH
ncbi:hypothetical protein [Flagellimonas lutimaris]|nr:hypothetical protein [Allomuricauda lutimaris]